MLLCADTNLLAVELPVEAAAEQPALRETSASSQSWDRHCSHREMQDKAVALCCRWDSRLLLYSITTPLYTSGMCVCMCTPLAHVVIGGSTLHVTEYKCVCVGGGRGSTYCYSLLVVQQCYCSWPTASSVRAYSWCCDLWSNTCGCFSTIYISVLLHP